MTARAKTVDQSKRGLLLLPIAAGCLYILAKSDPFHAPDFQVKEVLLDEAKLLIAAGALILDVRDRRAYESRHIAASILAPVAVLAAGIPASLQHARTMRVIVYCGDGAAIGPRGTHLLNQAGFASAVNLKPGLQGWAAAGLPVEHGAGILA